MRQTYKPDPEFRVRSLFESYQQDMEFFSIDYTVSMKYIEAIPFEPNDLSYYEGFDYVQVKDVIVIFSNDCTPETNDRQLFCSRKL